MFGLILKENPSSDDSGDDVSFTLPDFLEQVQIIYHRNLVIHILLYLINLGINNKRWYKQFWNRCCDGDIVYFVGQIRRLTCDGNSIL